jgi:hypothetical protein
MEKVFITRSTLYGIAFKTADIFRDQKDILNIYSTRLLKPFSHQEIKTISAVMSVLRSTDDEEIRLKIIEKYNAEFIKRKTDMSSPWVYVNNTPSFYMKRKCEKITANYENYSIPVQIKPENYQEYRDFFNKNRDLFHSDYQKYLSRVELKFNVRIENIKEIYAQNSGIKSLSMNKTTSKTPEQNLAAID